MSDGIISDINAYVNENGGLYPEWYIGISKDPEERLFYEHGVQKDFDAWIICPADSNNAARNVESYFINLGMDGGPGGGDWESDHVYSYKKNSHTDP